MKHKAMVRSSMILIVVLVSIATFTRPASAADDPNRILGRWAGVGQSSMLPAVQDSFFDVFFDVTTSCWYRRYMGEGEVGGFGRVTLDATIAASSVLNIQAVGPGGGCIQAHGKVLDVPPGPCRLAALSYHAFDAAGNLLDAGHILLIQYFGGNDWANSRVPAVQGMWMGDWMSSLFKSSAGGPIGGMAHLNVPQQMGSVFMGTLDFCDVFFPRTDSFFDVFFDLQGTVGPQMPDGSPVGTICWTRPDSATGSPGIIAILIGLLKPPNPTSPGMIQARYMFFGSFFDVFVEITRGQNTAFDVGSVELNPQPFPPGG